MVFSRVREKTNQGGLATVKTKHRKHDLVKGALVVGVDAGKGQHVGALRMPWGPVVKTVRFDNDLAGFIRLAKEVDHYREQMNLPRAVLGIEATGHYWLPLAYWWEDNKGPVVLVNPMHTNRAKELEDNSPLKSDPKDAEVISWLVSEGKYLECHLPRGVFATLRNLVQQRTRCGNQEARLVNQLHQAVELIFPELEQAFSSFRVKSFQEMLLRYADPEVVAEMTAEDLGKQLGEWSRGQLGKERAKRIIQLARESVGLREGKAAINSEVRRLVKQLQVAAEEHKNSEDEIKKCLQDVPGATLLLSVPDFGVLTVAGILAQTGDLRNYEHPDQVIKLAGLNLYEISSGQHKGRLRITKRGQGEFRKILYMAAMRACRRRGTLHSYYASLVGRGLASTSALVALMRKLLRVSWALVKKSQSFDRDRLIPGLAKAA
jgi:transposase